MPIRINEVSGAQFRWFTYGESWKRPDYEHFLPQFVRLARRPGKLRLLFDMIGFQDWVVEGRHFSIVAASLSLLSYDIDHPEVPVVVFWNAAPGYGIRAPADYFRWLCLSVHTNLVTKPLTLDTMEQDAGLPPRCRLGIPNGAAIIQE